MCRSITSFVPPKFVVGIPKCIPEQLPKAGPSKRGVEHTIKIELGSKSPNRPPYLSGLAK